MSRFTIQQKLRTGHVKRWQIVRVAREQTIAEHMFRVNLITCEITKALDAPQIVKTLASEWALSHDMPEIITGDIATPTKRAMREAVPEGDPVKRIELSLDEDYQNLYNKIRTQCPEVLAIVKIADLLEAIDFLEIEGMGKHAKTVKDGLIQAYYDNMLSSINKFSSYNWSKIDEIYSDMMGNSPNDLGVYPLTR